MRIHHKTRQSRRDFWAIYECEHCGHQQKRQRLRSRGAHMRRESLRRYSSGLYDTPGGLRRAGTWWRLFLGELDPLPHSSRAYTPDRCK